ncbi:cation-efflux pump [Blautia sp. An249]|uniref:cation diffusion facilitator family transporter n=1 Tax=Blautia sp. An249 TaxID=1965603 RepID=UPI000B3ADA7D|nr:cation diffusion facilitator family transporter [Blautia sp. An249]OUO80772.1 cation-efflux pump [Blautia sp. An249]
MEKTETLKQQKKTVSDERSQDMKIAMRISYVSILVNVVLSLFKLLAGILAHSGAMISDAVHSASDVFSTFIVMIGVHVSSKKSDKEHQYGHERMECVSSIILAVLLFLTGLAIGVSGAQKIFQGNGSAALAIPGRLALIAAIVSIGIKEWMFWYTRAGAKKINSGALMADAWHHRSDALSSVGSFIGIFGARMGYPIMDPLASIVICFFIGKAAYDIFKDAMDKMVDRSCDEKTQEKMRKVVLEQEGVFRIDVMRTRLFGAKMYVDLEIAADGNLSLSESHQIAEAVHRAIENNFQEVKHCMVHVNPIQEEKR